MIRTALQSMAYMKKVEISENIYKKYCRKIYTGRATQKQTNRTRKPATRRSADNFFRAAGNCGRMSADTSKSKD